MATPADLDNWYTYHPPKPGQTDAYERIRAKGKELAELFNEVSPSCADQTAAHRELRYAIMAMNATIACN